MIEPSQAVYVVDDDSNFRIILSRIIRKLAPAVEIREFSSPGLAIADLMVSSPPALIISDLIFPGTSSGLDMLRAARSRGIPCLVCSEVSDILDDQEVRPKDDVIRGMPAALGIALSSH